MGKDGGTLLTLTEKSVSGTHPEVQEEFLLVGASTASEFNTLRARLIPRGCFKLEDSHFAFDSSFVLPLDQTFDAGPLKTLMDKHPGAKLSIFGHADPVGQDTYNKTLSGRRAQVIFGMLIREVTLWEDLYYNHDSNGKDEWGARSVQFMLTQVGFPTGRTDGVLDDPTKKALSDFQTGNGLPQKGFDSKKEIDRATFKKLAALYMDAICTDDDGKQFKLTRDDFLARGQGKSGKGDFQGCGEFNPLMIFSKEEKAFFDNEENKSQRNQENQINRRVMVLVFRAGSRVDPEKWPCPSAKEGAAGCQKRFFSEGATRRSNQAIRREFKDTKDTFACRFYDRISNNSPCETPPPPVALVLTLTSPGIDDARKVSHGAAVMLNDDHDNGQLFPAAPPAGHRELEPIFDLDFIGEAANEDDLLKINLTLSQVGLPGDVDLKVVEGAAAGGRIRLWPKATKGGQADIIVLPAKIPAKDLPKELFVEGLQTGQATLEATFAMGGKALTDKLVVNVVELQESQGGARKIIYDYNSDIRFQVVGAPANYTFEWDLDGDGNFNTAVFEQGKSTGDVTCRYGPAEAANSVKLDQIVANVRQVYRVAVRMTGGLVLTVKGTTTIGQAVTQGMRVALNSNQGKALPVQSNAGLHTLFVWGETVPVSFSNATAAELANHQAQDGITQPFQGANRNQFGPLLAGANAVTPRPGVGAGRRVYGVIVGPGIFTSGQVEDDLVATVNHEIKHLQQHVAVRDNLPANNVWRQLDNFFGGANGYGDFREAEGHLSELQDPNVSWRHQLPAVQGDLNAFTTRYNASLGVLGTIPAGATRTAARQLLQEMYRGIPFFEMKRAAYNSFLRAPL